MVGEHGLCGTDGSRGLSYWYCACIRLILPGSIITSLSPSGYFTPLVDNALRMHGRGYLGPSLPIVTLHYHKAKKRQKRTSVRGL